MRSLWILLLSGLVSSAATLVANSSAEAIPRHNTMVTVPIAQLAARKGTRNKAPGDEADTLSSPVEGQSDAGKAGDRDALAECMAIWDLGTHITQSKWREICRRQIKERSAYSGSQSEP